MLSFLNELYTRGRSKTPSFWKKVQRMCIAIGLAGTTIVTTPEYYPEGFDEYAKYMLTIGLFGTMIAQFAKEDVPTPPEPVPTQDRDPLA